MKKIPSLLLFFFLLLASSCSNEKQTSYQIALDPQWYSLDVKGREQNLVGFMTEILKEISLNKKINVELVMRNWNNLTEGLKKNQYDAILSPIYPYLFNLKKYDFSHLILATGPVLIVPANSSIHSLEELSGKTVAIQIGSEGAILLEKNPEILPRAYESIPQALNHLASGEIDGAIVNILAAQAYCKDLYQGILKIATPPLNDQGIRLLTLHENNEHLIKLFNQGLIELNETGKYQELLQKWSLN